MPVPRLCLAIVIVAAAAAPARAFGSDDPGRYGDFTATRVTVGLEICMGVGSSGPGAIMRPSVRR